MRVHRRKSDQLELFGLPNRANTVPTPQWRSLPTHTRQQITELMTRLLMEHRQEHQTQQVEAGDV